MIDNVLSLIGLYLLGCGFGLYNVYKLKQEGYHEYGYETAFNPSKWFSVLTGYLLSYIIPPHVVEQLVLRLHDEECRKECLNGNGGKCIHCGCNTLAKMYSPMETCSNGNWGPIVFNKKEYEEFRKKYPIKISIKYEQDK